jgi:hypothetical protein
VSSSCELEGIDLVLNIFNVSQNLFILNNGITHNLDSKLRTGICA